MKKQIIISIALFIVFPNLVSGWTRTYGGNMPDEGNSIQQTSDGGYIIAGYTESYGAGGSDLYLIKTDDWGNITWSKTYGGSEIDVGYSVQQTTNGGYIVLGSTESFGVGGEDIYLIKTNSNGDTLWSNTGGGQHFDRGNCIQQTTDGGFIITGSTSSYGAGSYDIFLAKTDQNGDSVWARTFGGSSVDRGLFVQQTDDEGYIVVGYTYSFGGGNYSDIILVKTDDDGDSSWTKIIGTTQTDKAFSVQQTTDGGYIIVGYTINNGVESDIWLIKTDNYGNTMWIKSIGTSSFDEWGYSVQQTTDGGYIIVGDCWTGYPNYFDIWLIKTNSNGDTLWTKTFGIANHDYGKFVKQTTDGGYIILGNSEISMYDSDIYLIKTDAYGVAVEEIILSYPFETSFHIDQLTDNSVNLEFCLYQNSTVKLNIFDLTGRFISTPLSQSYSAGNHNINFNIENKGVYFFNLKIDQNNYSGKFLVL
ncbi:MAG: hypothetical protein APR63_14440 [Desulfuromonas sp. SDB]|nr:MAG: hypothetical protein APR63_14440 [Desulfuromonas sp. SDB]